MHCAAPLKITDTQKNPWTDKAAREGWRSPRCQSPAHTNLVAARNTCRFMPPLAAAPTGQQLSVGQVTDMQQLQCASGAPRESHTTDTCNNTSPHISGHHSAACIVPATRSTQPMQDG